MRPFPVCDAAEQGDFRRHYFAPGEQVCPCGSLRRPPTDVGEVCVFQPARLSGLREALEPGHAHGDQPCDPSEEAAIAQWEAEQGLLDIEVLREAAQAVLEELDIIRAHPHGRIVVHIDTHKALRAALAERGTEASDMTPRTGLPWTWGYAKGIEGLPWDIYATGPSPIEGWLVASVGEKADAILICEAVNAARNPEPIPDTPSLREAALDVAWKAAKEAAYGQFLYLFGQVHTGAVVPIRWHAKALGATTVEVWADTEVAALDALVARLASNDEAGAKG